MGLRLVPSLLVVLSSFAFIDATRFVCFLDEYWGIYRTALNSNFNVNKIDLNLCTHIVFSHAFVEDKTFRIQVDTSTPTTTPTFQELRNFESFEKFIALNKTNSRVKIMISVGNFTAESDNDFSKLVANRKNINIFAQSAVLFLQKYKFDGLHLHWIPTDKAGFASLALALKKAFYPHGYLLSAVGSPFENKIDAGYDISQLNTTLDFLNVWAMDFHIPEKESKFANHHAPLRLQAGDKSGLCAECAVNHWINKGFALNKIILSIPLYGRAWMLPSDSPLMNPPPPAAAAGAFSGNSGSIWPYYEICNQIKWNEEKWKVFKDPTQKVGPYAISQDPFNRVWVGYDDPAMAIVKTKYILEKRLGGVAVWEISMDDSRNVCGNGVNPIMIAISNAILNKPQNSSATIKSSETFCFIIVFFTVLGSLRIK